jgi:ribonuclease G
MTGMSKEMIISSSAHETRVAILEDDQVAEVFIERERQRGVVGNLYKGRVSKVLPGMQSAFVDLGLERDGFLYVSDVIAPSEEFDRLETEEEAPSPVGDNGAPTPLDDARGALNDSRRASLVQARRGPGPPDRGRRERDRDPSTSSGSPRAKSRGDETRTNSPSRTRDLQRLLEQKENRNPVPGSPPPRRRRFGETAPKLAPRAKAGRLPVPGFHPASVCSRA